MSVPGFWKGQMSMLSLAKTLIYQQFRDPVLFEQGHESVSRGCVQIQLLVVFVHGKACNY